MNKSLVTLTIVLILAFVSGGCGPTQAGPRTWFDRPLERDNPVPVQSITLQAHSSDANGVASLVFAVDGQPINEVTLDGGRLGYGIVEWEPPGPGTYSLTAQGRDNAGNLGGEAKVELVVVGEDQWAALQIPSPTPDQEAPSGAGEDEELDPEEAISPTVEDGPNEPAATARQNSNCRQGPGTAFGVVAIIEQGQTVPIVGQSPSQDHFVVVEPANSRDCWIAVNLVDVEGDLGEISTIDPPSPPIVEEQPDEPPSEPEPEEPPPPTQDQLPPIILNISISPGEITVESGGCSGEPRTSASTITIHEEGGIHSVSATWSIGTKSGTVPYFTADGVTYVGQFGPVDTHGTMNISGSVVDKAGNSTPFEHTLTVVPCVD